MKRAFTLVELMVVVGIMAFLGVAATGGYSALQRGMAERSAVDVAVTILQAAKERALVDRQPTALFCYNRLLREATEDENAVVVGEAVAIRRAGRITGVSGQHLIDEFLDAVGSYDIEESSGIANRKGMKLWRFDDKKMSQMQYSIVADAVVPYDGATLKSFDFWAKGEPDPGTNMPHIVYSFWKLSGSSHEPAGWVAGNGYGFEFAHVQLPNNFIFESAVPSQVGQIEQVKAMYFDPDNMQDDNVTVRVCMPNASGMQRAHHDAGVASSKEKGQVL